MTKSNPLSGRARTLMLAAVAVGALALGAAPALASLAGEVSQGRAVAAQLKAGSTSCSKLADSDFEHLGEYVMERMVGSRAAHQAMNSRMEARMGSATADRMHEALGRRFAGCPTKGTAEMMGGALMGSAGGGWSSMMGSGNTSWMRNGTWRHMTSAQWNRSANTMMSGGWMMSGSKSGWSSAAVIGVVILALGIGGVVVLAVVRRPRGDLSHGPTGTA